MNIKKPNSFARYGNDYVAPLTTIDQIVKPSGERYTDKEFELMSNVENVMFGDNGAGKNLLNPTLQTQTKDGVTCTNNEDGTYTLNGTASDTVYIDLTNIGYTDLSSFGIEKGKTYKLAGCPSGGNDITSYSLRLDANPNGNIIDEGNGITFTLQQGSTITYKPLIKVVKGTTCNNLVFKPMITEDLSTTYDDFEPYVKSLRQLTDSALNMDLLWENASLGSAFTSQTISLDLSQYKSFVITYIANTNNIASETSQFYPATGQYTVSWLYYFFTENLFRIVVIKTTGVDFGDCVINGESYNNERLLPHKIYGVR